MNNLATDLDIAILKGLKTKKGEILKNKSMTEILKNALNCEQVLVCEDGTEIPYTMGERIVAATLNKCITSPSTDNLKNIFSMTGELKETKEIEISKVDEDLAKRALGDEKDN